MKEAESEAQSVAQAAAAARGTMEKAASAWETHDGCLASLQAWLTEATWSETPSPAAGTQVICTTPALSSPVFTMKLRKL